jgi:hypothetical protein
MSKSSGKKETKSFLKLIQDLESKDSVSDNFYSHIAICLEISPDGFPSGRVTRVKGAPYEVLGLIDVAIAELQATREKVLERFEIGPKAQRSESGKDKKGFSSEGELMKRAVENTMGDAPDFVKDIIKKHAGDLKDALMNSDKEKLDEIKAKIEIEIQETMEKNGYSSGDGDDDDDDDDDDDEDFPASKKGFDINDFK